MLKIIINKVIYIFIIYIYINFHVFAGNFPGDSIYNLNSQLIEKNGNNVNISDLQGKIQIFSMIYTNCKTTCPIIISNMKSIEKLLPVHLLRNVNFLLISLDPERDSIISLNKFFKEKNLNNEKWRLFRTSREEVLNIALAVGIKYKKEKNNEYMHSNLIIVLDKDGVIKLHHQGLDKNYVTLISIIKSLK